MQNSTQFAISDVTLPHYMQMLPFDEILSNINLWFYFRSLSSATPYIVHRVGLVWFSLKSHYMILEFDRCDLIEKPLLFAHIPNDLHFRGFFRCFMTTTKMKNEK